MREATFFVASSGTSTRVANLVARGLENRGCGRGKVWNEDLFGSTEGVLERLIAATSEFDFAIIIWAADDRIESKGVVSTSPRDNTVFESGLFMGALGREFVFIVCDKEANVKIPSDFGGVVLARYDQTRIEDGLEAVRDACDQIERAIKRPRYPQLVGSWKTRYVKATQQEHDTATDDVVIVERRGGIVIHSLPNASSISYQAEGTVHGRQISGRYQHREGKAFIEGLFMLVVNPGADQMCGYCTDRDENDAMVFATWVFVKKEGRSEEQIDALLVSGEKRLMGRTFTSLARETG